MMERHRKLGLLKVKYATDREERTPPPLMLTKAC